MRGGVVGKNFSHTTFSSFTADENMRNFTDSYKIKINLWSSRMALGSIWWSSSTLLQGIARSPMTEATTTTKGRKKIRHFQVVKICCWNFPLMMSSPRGFIISILRWHRISNTFKVSFMWQAPAFVPNWISQPSQCSNDIKVEFLFLAPSAFKRFYISFKWLLRMIIWMELEFLSMFHFILTCYAAVN